MEYIKKEDLIKGEVYNCLTPEGNKYIVKLTHNFNNCININKARTTLYKDGYFGRDTLKFSQTTPEEKHWFLECIKEDKFITFEEAIESFIPEYVECIKQLIGSVYKLGMIYKVNDNGFIKNDSYSFAHYKFNQYRFKPSTKEAYDAQVVVKEPKFVLPEKWCIAISEDIDGSIRNWFNKQNSTTTYNNLNNYFLYLSWKGIANGDHLTNYIKQDHIQITFEQFKKYVLKEEVIEEKVIEPLPQFKVIESIETITKVENNEGNQFFIGDIVKSSNGVIQKIESFDYNKAKTNIIAFTNKQPKLGNGIGIDKIEHYIESKNEVEPEFILPEKWFIRTTENTFDIIINWAREKSKFLYKNYRYYEYVNFNYLGKYRQEIGCKEITFDQFKKYVLKEEVKEETLLEKAKRLYPIGTKVNSLGGCENQIIDSNTPFMSGEDGVRFTNNCLVYLRGKWAKIIN